MKYADSTIVRLVVALFALHACTPSTTRTGDASMNTNDSSTNDANAADASTDAPILPDVGTWAWAQYEAETGRYIRRVSWPSGSLVRRSGNAYQLSNNGGANWFSSAWTPATDDTAATNWTSRAP